MRRIVRPLGYGVVAVAFLIVSAHAQVTTQSSFTLDADFDLGTILNLNHDAPNNNQMQVNPPGVVTTFPFINIANSDRGTAVRIDVNTGAILGEYLTAPDFMGRNPSRTTVDQAGNAWVSNRNEGGTLDGQAKGSVMRFGLLVGGTRSNSDGTPNPVGDYVKPPYDYNTCVDRNSDGLIKTSRGLADIRPWGNAGSVDSDGGVDTAEDECIINYTRIVGSGARTIAVDANNDVWTGGLNDLDHEKISGVTGLPVAGTQFNLGCGGYGGFIDGAGVLWSARGGTGLLRFVPNPTPPPAGAGACLGGGLGDYGLGIDPTTGEVWHSYLQGGSTCKLTPAGALIACYGHGNFYAQGVAVDGSGNVWVAHSLLDCNSTVGHLRTDGTFVGNVALPGGCNGPTGVAVDTNGKVWVTSYYTHATHRIDPAAGAAGGGGFPIGAVDLTVSLGAGAGPYNYSDMTGAVALGSTSKQGSFTIVHDTTLPDTPWGAVVWNTEPEGFVPADAEILVEGRASNSQAGLSGEVFQPLTSGAQFVASGRFLEVRSTLKMSPADLSPVLSNLRIYHRTCNVDADSDVDIDDIALINAARNTATNPADARDYDSNGIINLNDSRGCVTKCTRARCAR